MLYRGYTASIEADSDAGCIHGEIANIVDVVTFEADSLENVEREFHASVDDYLEFCRELGRKPAQPSAFEPD